MDIRNEKSHDSFMRIAVIAVPALLLCAFVLAYARSFPVWETWYFIPVWADFRDGGPWLADLFISRWGHITAFPNFINLILDRVFNYNQRAGILFSVATMVLALYLLLKHYLPRSSRFTAVFLALTFLTIRAAEIWLDAWNTAMTISLLLAIAAGACVLRSSSWKWLVLCALLTFIGINSGGYCLPVLPAVTLALIAQSLLGQRNRKQAMAQVTAWLAFSALVLLYWRAMRRGNPGLVLHTALTPEFYMDFSRELAFALGDGRLGAAILVAAAAVFLLSLPFGLRKLRQMENLPSLIFLIIYAGVLGVLIGTARTLQGTLPLHARYIPFLCLLPIALLAFAETALSGSSRSGDQVFESMRGGLRWLLAILVATALYNDFSHWNLSRGNAPQMAALDRAWQDSPETLTPGMFLHRAHPDAGIIAKGLAIMQQFRMGPFARSKSSNEPALRAAVRDEHLYSTAVHSGWDQSLISADGSATLAGWAFDSTANSALVTVFVRIDDTCSERALTGLPRPDVARALNAPAASHSGWLITLPPACAKKAEGKPVTVYLVTRDHHWSSQSRAL